MVLRHGRELPEKNETGRRGVNRARMQWDTPLSSITDCGVVL